MAFMYFLNQETYNGELMNHLVQVSFEDTENMEDMESSVEIIDKIENYHTYIKIYKKITDNGNTWFWYPISIIYRKDKIVDILSKRYDISNVHESLKLYQKYMENI